jgi:hypothetical protein
MMEVNSMLADFKWKDAKTDIKPKHEKSSWILGPQGNYDGVPRAYLEAKPDPIFVPKEKLPWLTKD